MPTLAEQIAAGRTLKKVESVADRSAPAVHLDDAQAQWEADANENYYLDLGMEKWLRLVEDLTFKTGSVPIDQEEAKVIRKAYSHLLGGTVKASSLPPDLVERLSVLGRKLIPAVQEFAGVEGTDGTVFAKLSGRSAKDSPLLTGRLDAAIDEHCAGSDEKRLFALFESALHLMRVRDVAHLLWLMINSQRVDEDLDVALRHPERWDQCVVVRSWWPGVASDLEFRMFVTDGIPTGLTQYNHIIYSQRIASRGAAIASALTGYYEREVKPRLIGTAFYETVKGHFTCDLALHPEALALIDQAAGSGPELSTEQIKLVELNCFYAATGMGLFDYYADADTLRDGPFEWRVRTEPLPQAAVKLENEWRGLLKPKREPRHLTDEAWEQLTKAVIG
jgi:hypothetical protein